MNPEKIEHVVTAIAAKFGKGMAPEERDDLRQELWSKALALTETEMLERELKATAKSFRHSESWRKRKTKEFGGISDLESLSTIDAATPESVDVRRALERLTPKERAVANLIQEGLSNQDIAKELDRSLRWVDTYKSKALAKLKKILGDDYLG